MAVIMKCKMCGGDLELAGGSTIATCEYCGTTQTVPSQDNEKKLVQFDRADRLRRNCEFDKAAGVYESIVADFRQEAEAYWGLVLCKYGIEYVDDPATGKKVPTCHRSSFDSVMDDANFEQVLENADALSRKIYREEAKRIEEIRKGIIEVSSREGPYDIFICYKETAEDGQRTVDSVLAQDLYDALTDKGYRVFFSRISLEDKLGQEYEPYIFAALNSAKVMLAIGTDYEYFNAVWVKNEWSRFLKLMQTDKNKHLIPCFKGIDAYDMPREFNKLQAQDLGKIGAQQDLLRGIDKLIAAKPAAVQQTAGVQSDDVNRIYTYNSALDEMKSKKVKNAKSAVKKLESLGDWNDAPQQLEKARKHLKKRKTVRTTRRVILLAIFLAIVGSIGALTLAQLKDYYTSGVACMEKGQYARAASKFSQAEFYSDAAQMEAAARSNAQIADEKLRSLVGNNGQPTCFYGDGFVEEALENHSFHEGEVILHEGTSYNGYLEYVTMDFVLAGDSGNVTYLVEKDALLLTPNNGGSPMTIRIENGNLYMEDGTVYTGSAAAMEKLSTQIAALLESADVQQAEELMAFMMELVYNGFMDVDESILGNVAALVEKAATMIENGHDDGFDLILNCHMFMLEVCSSGKVTDGQAAYNAVERIVDTGEHLLNQGHEEAIELLMLNMEYMSVVESGVFGDDFAVVEQFKLLYDRCEKIINEYW